MINSIVSDTAESFSMHWKYYICLSLSNLTFRKDVKCIDNIESREVYIFVGELQLRIV